MYAVIVGGGKVGFFLARALIEAGHEVLVLENLERRYQLISDSLGEAVMLGDGTEVRTLERAGVGRADVVVAVTGDDEDNLVCCQLAKTRFNVRRIIARINNPKNEEIFKLLGIDETVSATHLLQSLIEQELETEEMLPLSPLQRGNLEIVEIHIPAYAPVIGKMVRDIRLPAGCLLAVLLRAGRASVVQGDTALRADDLIIALTPVDGATSLREALLGSSPRSV
jgi:trk system potassium uptake protein TrkA